MMRLSAREWIPCRRSSAAGHQAIRGQNIVNNWWERNWRCITIADECYDVGKGIGTQSRERRSHAQTLSFHEPGPRKYLKGLLSPALSSSPESVRGIGGEGEDSVTNDELDKIL